MEKAKTESFLFIKKPWVGGNGDTIYLGIPSKIVKQLQISENSYLMIDLIDDSIIVIKKYDPQFTKDELNRVISHQDKTSEEPTVVEDNNKSDDEEEFVNPLKDLNL